MQLCYSVSIQITVAVLQIPKAKIALLTSFPPTIRHVMRIYLYAINSASSLRMHEIARPPTFLTMTCNYESRQKNLVSWCKRNKTFKLDNNIINIHVAVQEIFKFLDSDFDNVLVLFCCRYGC